MAKKTKYKIGEACRELDIQPYVLRYWETEFPQLSDGASGTGQRTYSEFEIRIIKRIKELLYEEGYTIAGAKKKLEAEVGEGELPTVESDEQQELPVQVSASDAEAPPEKARAKKTPKSAKKSKPKDNTPEAETAASTKKPKVRVTDAASAPEDDGQISKRLELIRSDLETLRDEARSVADRLRDS